MMGPCGVLISTAVSYEVKLCILCSMFVLMARERHHFAPRCGWFDMLSMCIYENYVGRVLSICVTELVPAVECPLQNIVLDDSEALHDQEG